MAAYLSKYSETFQKIFFFQFRVHTDNFRNYFFFVDFVSLFLFNKIFAIASLCQKNKQRFQILKALFWVRFLYLLSLVLPTMLLIGLACIKLEVTRIWLLLSHLLDKYTFGHTFMNNEFEVGLYQLKKLVRFKFNFLALINNKSELLFFPLVSVTGQIPTKQHNNQIPSQRRVKNACLQIHAAVLQQHI